MSLARQTSIVVMANLEYHGLAQKLGVVYLAMYPISVVTMTFWTALALYFVEENSWNFPLSVLE